MIRSTISPGRYDAGMLDRGCIPFIFITRARMHRLLLNFQLPGKIYQFDCHYCTIEEFIFHTKLTPTPRMKDPRRFIPDVPGKAFPSVHTTPFEFPKAQTFSWKNLWCLLSDSGAHSEECWIFRMYASPSLNRSTNFRKYSPDMFQSLRTTLISYPLFSTYTVNPTSGTLVILTTDPSSPVMET